MKRIGVYELDLTENVLKISVLSAPLREINSPTTTKP